MNNKIDYNQIIEIVLKAGDLIKNNIDSHYNIKAKSKSNYITELDTLVENTIITEISNIYADQIFFTEEGLKNKSQAYWTIDPIDGTTNLIHKFPSVAISIAHIINDVIIFGCVYNPFSKELFFAQKGNGAFMKTAREENKIHVSDISSIDHSLINFGCPYDKNKITYLFLKLERLFKHCDDLKRVGPASYDLCQVACGRTDAYLELDLELWDYAAGFIILQEAGGIITNWKGSKNLFNKNHILATNGIIHTEILRILAD